MPVCGEESRWASAAREMIATGDWIVPRQQGTVFPERPPLGSWAMALVALVHGDVDLVAIRLPSALATLALVLLIYLYARRWVGRLGSLAAAAIYATFGQVMQIGARANPKRCLLCSPAGPCWFGTARTWPDVRERSPGAWATRSPRWGRW